jgi:hypothetical protein
MNIWRGVQITIRSRMTSYTFKKMYMCTIR